jgi:hypothetical protein
VNMMVPNKSLLFAGAALLFCSTAVEAQQVRRITQPVGEVTLDANTGTFTRLSSGQTKGAPGFNTVRTFRHTSLSGFVGIDTGGGACEWVQSATKTGGQTTFVTNLRFAYCSAELDANSGGTGGTTRIGFREGYTLGSAANALGQSGTETAFFNITGLPANTKHSGFFGGAFCTFINFGLGTTAFCLPDGPFAYSWEFQDLGTDGVLGATFPFFACVASCSGPLAFPPGSTVDGDGTSDLVDQYCPPSGGVDATFSFGTSTSGFNFTSINMELREAEHITSSQSTFNPTVAVMGGGFHTNPAILTPGLVGGFATPFGGSSNAPGIPGPIQKGSFDFSIDCTGAAAAKLALFRASFDAPPIPFNLKYGNVMLVIGGGNATGVNIFVPHGGGGVALAVPVALDISAFGACFPFQGFCGANPFGYLSNAILATLGSQ